MKTTSSLTILITVMACGPSAGQADVDLGMVAEHHVMVPVGDGKRLSA